MKPIINLFLKNVIITINPDMVVFKDLISVEQAENIIRNLRSKLK